MAETFDQARDALKALFETMTGMSADTVYAQAPQGLQDFPCMLFLPNEGKFAYEVFGGSEINKEHLVRGIVVGGVLSDLTERQEALTPFIDRVPDLLRTSPNLGLSTVAQPAMATGYKFITFVYNQVQHLAVEFVIRVEVYDDV